MIWPPELESFLRLLLVDTDRHPPQLREQGEWLGAVPLGEDLWGCYFVRPHGEVVIIGEDLHQSDALSTYSDDEHRGRALSWLLRRYPEVERIFERPTDATDCPCQVHHFFASRKIACSTCGGLGWLTPANPDRP